MLYRRVALAFVAAGLALSPVSAWAGTISYSRYTLIAGQSVELGGSVLHGRTESAEAGEIQLQRIGGGSGTIESFCIDVTTWLLGESSFSAGSFLTGSFGNQVNALISHVLPTFAQNANASAALQVAIWKAEYGAGLSVWGNDAVTSLAATYLQNVTSGAWTADPNQRVAMLVGRDNQDQAYLAPAPEPASLAILGAGLLGVGLVAAAGTRRRKPSVEHVE